MQLPPDFVIFDCDGVLVDSEGITNLVIQDNLAKYGLHVAVDDIIRLFVGGTMSGVMTQARSMGAALPDDWLDEIYPEMITRLGQEVTLVPGAVDVLDALDAAGIGYAVGSNGPHRKMDVTLARTGSPTPDINFSVTIGILVNDELQKAISFWNDPSITIRQVNKTCERCPIDDCEERAHTATIIERRAERKKLQDALKKVME